MHLIVSYTSEKQIHYNWKFLNFCITGSPTTAELNQKCFRNGKTTWKPSQMFHSEATLLFAAQGQSSQPALGNALVRDAAPHLQD